MARPISSRWSTVAAPISAASPTRKITIYGWSTNRQLKTMGRKRL